MYSETIKDKVDTLFADLREKALSYVSSAQSSEEAIETITKVVGGELASRSRTILSDMLYALSDEVLESDFYRDSIERQNRFFAANLRQEILCKYQFSSTTTIDHEEADRLQQALLVGGATLAAGAAIEVGVVLCARLPFSALVPVPVAALVAISLGMALADYYAIEPAKNQKNLATALDSYLTEAKAQFLGWFDEVERYFRERVEALRQTM